MEKAWSKELWVWAMPSKKFADVDLTVFCLQEVWEYGINKTIINNIAYNIKQKTNGLR